MPFLVDSVVGEVQAHGIAVQHVLHPIIKVEREADGTLVRIIGPGDRNWGDGHQESLIVLLVDDVSADAASEMAGAIEKTLHDVRLAVTDWQTMLARFDDAIKALQDQPPPIAPGLLAETLAFCRWLRDGQFTFLGCRSYRLTEGSTALVPVETGGLGVLRDSGLSVTHRDGDALVAAPELSRFLLSSNPLIIAKSSVMSRVHRRVYMDYIGLKTYAQDGKLTGELSLIGLFTSVAYTQTARLIPFIRHKIEHVIGSAGFAPGSHASKALVNVLETFPRDELFQISEAQLLDWSRGIVDLELKPRVRVFARTDRFERYVSALVYAPRDRFSTAVRERIATLLSDAFHGHVTAFTPFFPEGPLVRVHFIIARDGRVAEPADIPSLERQIAETMRTWGGRVLGGLVRGGQVEDGSTQRSTGMHSRPVIPRRSLPIARLSTSIGSSGCRRNGRWPSISTARPMIRLPGCALPCTASTNRSPCPAACRCWKTSASR